MAPGVPLPPSTGSPNMEQKIFLPGSTYRQSLWDPRVSSARIEGWATGIDAADGSPRRSVVDKYFCTYGYFFPEEITDNNLILDHIDVQMRSPTKAKFSAVYKVQTFNTGGGGSGAVFNAISLRPRDIVYSTYRQYTKESAAEFERLVDNNGMPAGDLNLPAGVTVGVGNKCNVKQMPRMVPQVRAGVEMTVTVNLGQNPLVFLQELHGALNEFTVTIIGVTFNKGSVMYLGESMEIMQNRFGEFYIVTYHFSLDTFAHIEQQVFLADSANCLPGSDVEWQTRNVPMGPSINFTQAFPG